MDKYQQTLMKRISIHEKDESQPKNSKYLTISAGLDELTIKQDDDINITKYKIAISGDSIDGCYTIKGNSETSIAKQFDKNQNEYILELNFDKKIDAIKLKFIRDFADEVVLPINYIDADKEKYNEARRFNEACIGYSMINDPSRGYLINISFQPCDRYYSYTEISIYKANFNVLISPNSLEKKNEIFEIMRYKMTDDNRFLQIPNLTPGEYLFKLRQYGKTKGLLLQTELIPLNQTNSSLHTFAAENRKIHDYVVVNSTTSKPQPTTPSKRSKKSSR